MVAVVKMTRLARCMDLIVVAIVAADCMNTGLVAVVLSIPPINIAQKNFIYAIQRNS